MMADISGLLAKYRQIPGERFFVDVFTSQEYKPALAVKADTVLDVGACAGEFAAYIYPQAKVIYALEPYTKHYAELESNVQDFGLVKIKPFKLGLAKTTGLRSFESGTRGGGHLIPETEKTDRTEEIETKTLAQFLKDEGIERIDILKIDIEGGEDEVFRADDIVEALAKTQFIIGEHLGSVDPILQENGFKLTSHGNNAIYSKL